MISLFKALVLLSIFVVSSNLKAQIGLKTNADSLELELTHAKSKSDRLDILVPLFKYYQNRDLGRSLILSTEAYQIAKDISNKTALEDAIIVQATAYLRMDEIDSALVYYEKWIVYAKKGKDKIFEARAHLGLGVLYGKQEIYDMSLLNFEIAKKIFKDEKDTLHYIHVQSNIGVAFKMMGEYDKAMEIFADPELTRLSELLNDHLHIAITNQNIAQVLVSQEKYEAAAVHFNKALEIVGSDTMHYVYGEIMVDLGHLYLASNKLELAERYTKRGLSLAKQFGDIQGVVYALEIYADIKRADGDFEAALEFMEEFWSIKDSIASVAVDAKLANSKSLHTIKEQQQKLEFLTKDKEAQSYRMKFIIGAFSFAVAMVLMVFIYFIGKARSNRLKQRLLVDQVSGQKNDLINLSLYIGQKNELLELLKKEIRTIKRTHDETQRNEQLSELLMLVSQKTGLDRDIEILQSQMKEFSSEFTTQLTDKHPDLTNNEKTLAGMLRLGFSTKEIAVMINSVENTVNVNRYRLRKKLELTRDISLKDYLNHI